MLAGGGGILLFLGVASLSSTIAAPGDADDRVAGREAAQDAGRPRPPERGPIPTAHVVERVGADDRRRPRQCGGGVRVVDPRHVRRHVGAGDQRRLRHHRRRIPGARPRRRRDAGRGSRGRCGDADPRGDRTGRRRAEGVRGDRSGRLRPDGQRRSEGRHDRRPAGGRGARAVRSGERPRPRGRLGRAGHVPERRHDRPHGGRHLRRCDVRQLADQPRHAGVGDRCAGPRLLRDRQARRRRRSPAEGDAAVAAAMEPFPQANVQTNAEFRASQEAQINQLLLDHLDAAGVRHRHRHPRHLDHARPRCVRADARDRPAARGRA